MLEGKGDGCFEDISSITMFADYRLPQILVYLGALKYSDDLLKKLLEGLLLCGPWLGCSGLSADRSLLLRKQSTSAERIHAGCGGGFQLGGDRSRRVVSSRAAWAIEGDSC